MIFTNGLLPPSSCVSIKIASLEGTKPADVAYVPLIVDAPKSSSVEKSVFAVVGTISIL